MKPTFSVHIISLFKKFHHLWWQLYWLIYLPWFSYLEKTVTKQFHVIHMTIDDYIPFCEYFVIPYFLWFVYVAAGIIYFALKNKEEYYNLCKILFFGMTVFLVVSTIYPNGHCLRPASFIHDNIFTDMVCRLYAMDTPTNIFPSIHVYNSIVVNAVIRHCENFKKNYIIRCISGILMISIVLSTIFLKQHSIFDVITGILLAYTTTYFVYHTKTELSIRQCIVHKLHKI